MVVTGRGRGRRRGLYSVASGSAFQAPPSRHSAAPGSARGAVSSGGTRVIAGDGSGGRRPLRACAGSDPHDEFGQEFLVGARRPLDTKFALCPGPARVTEPSPQV